MIDWQFKKGHVVDFSLGVWIILCWWVVDEETYISILSKVQRLHCISVIRGLKYIPSREHVLFVCLTLPFRNETLST